MCVWYHLSPLLETATIDQSMVSCPECTTFIALTSLSGDLHPAFSVHGSRTPTKPQAWTFIPYPRYIVAVPVRSPVFSMTLRPMLQPGLQPCLGPHLLLFLVGAPGWTPDLTHSLAMPEVVNGLSYQHLVLSTMIRPRGTVPVMQTLLVLELPLTPGSDLFVGQLHFCCYLTHTLTVSLLKPTTYNGSHQINKSLSVTLTSHSSSILPISSLKPNASFLSATNTFFKIFSSLIMVR